MGPGVKTMASLQRKPMLFSSVQHLQNSVLGALKEIDDLKTVVLPPADKKNKSGDVKKGSG